MAKGRRDTAYFAARSSLFLTDETRGVPYKWISVVISISYLFFGLRNVFFCGAKLPVGKGEDLIMDLWSGCSDDAAKPIFAGLHGLGDWLIAIVRFSMAMTKSTSDLFFTMLLLALYSTGFLVACIRAGITDVSWYYLTNMSIGFLYESYVCYLAYQAYSKRQKIKSAIPDETGSIPFKTVFLAKAACWMIYATKMFVACDVPYILISSQAQIDLFESTWHDCRTHPRPDVRLGWATMASVHAFLLAGICVFAFLAKSMTSLKGATALICFYDNGVLFLFLRAGLGVVPPVFLAFVLGSYVHDINVLYMIVTNTEAGKRD